MPPSRSRRFHKASLVHDDIEDDDPHRYGEPTLHNQFGIPSAINIGDYLIGMGYRLGWPRHWSELGAEVVAETLAAFAEAHQKLSEGQGAELFWRDARDKRLAPLDALKIYALENCPGVRGRLDHRLPFWLDNTETYREPFKQFARNLGIGFQIHNDLKDWQGDDDNKLAGRSGHSRRSTDVAVGFGAGVLGCRTEQEELICAGCRQGNDRNWNDLVRMRQLFQKGGRLREISKDDRQSIVIERRQSPTKFNRTNCEDCYTIWSIP